MRCYYHETAALQLHIIISWAFSPLLSIYDHVGILVWIYIAVIGLWLVSYKSVIVSERKKQDDAIIVRGIQGVVMCQAERRESLCNYPLAGRTCPSRGRTANIYEISCECKSSTRRADSVLHAISPTNKLNVTAPDALAPSRISEYQLVEVLAANFILDLVSECILIQTGSTHASSSWAGNFGYVRIERRMTVKLEGALTGQP